MRAALLLVGTMVLFLGPPAAALVAGEGVPLPLGDNCGRWVEEGVGFNCARVWHATHVGECALGQDSWECPFEVVLYVESYWWKNGADLHADLDGPCSDHVQHAWTLLKPPVQRIDKAGCDRTVEVPLEGCADLAFTYAVRHASAEPPRAMEGTFVLPVCPA